MIRSGWILTVCGVLAIRAAGAGGQPAAVVPSFSSGGAAFALTHELLTEPLRIGGEQGPIYFETEKGRTRIKSAPLTVLNETNRCEAAWNVDGRVVTARLTACGGDAFRLVLGASPDDDITGWGLSIGATPDEYFTGIFERTVDGDQSNSWAEGVSETLNLRGQQINMFTKATLSLYCPFYISSRNYSLFVDSTWPGTYDFCKSDPERVQIYFEGPSMDLTIQAAAGPAGLVRQHSLRVGPAFMPPRWAFGHWRWRDNNRNDKSYFDGTEVTAPFNSMLVEDVLMMKALDIPCSAVWIDRPFGPGRRGYDDFEWDPEQFPNAEKMIRWVNSEGMEFLLWIAPWVNGKMADTLKEKGYGVPGQIRDIDHSPLVDFTNPEARRWWQVEGLAKMLKQGVAGFKLDRSEELVPYDRTHRVHDGRINRENHNDYPVQYVRATYEICREIRGDGNFVCMPRAGFIGSARWGVFWGGDINTPPEGLRTAIIAQQRAAVMGYPFWGSDTGGYWGRNHGHETIARWLAFSCFSPIMEVGPTRNRGLWDMDTEPAYDVELLAVWRLYARLHTELMDYSYACAQEAVATGMPVVRPLFLTWPEQQQSWEDWQTYTYGPDILVSAIWRLNVSEHALYLPAGESWIDAWSGKEHAGGQTVTVETPVHKIPIFIRKGSALKLGDLNALYKESLEIAAKKPSMAELQEKAFDGR